MITLGELDLVATALYPPPGHVQSLDNLTMLCTTVTIINNGENTLSFSNSDWVLQDPSGASRSVTRLETAGHSGAGLLGSGRLAPAEKTYGDVCFDNTGNPAGQFVVLYESSGSRAAWVIQR
ncbi:DUF4352 domain-containing protein [Modestobacter lapidis]|nr:DUF4352 domain-containing protein [Modestobacter lapidis]